MTTKKYLGIPRTQIHWEPTIDNQKCIGCAECLDVCPNGVYIINTTESKVEVVNPENCVVLCDKCAGFCNQNAISFPDRETTKHFVAKLLKQIGE